MPQWLALPYYVACPVFPDAPNNKVLVPVHVLGGDSGTTACQGGADVGNLTGKNMLI